jgi:hypothetical protein
MSRYTSSGFRWRRSILMSKRLSAALLAVLLPTLAACAAQPSSPDAPIVATVIVKPRAPSAPDAVVSAVREPLGRDAGVRYARELAGGAHLVYLTAPATREQVPALIERLRASAAFQYVEPDSMMKRQ